MRIDPIISAASSVQAAPGTVALLLGSGVSRSAQIPTGWDIVQSLIRRLAAATGEDVPDEPVAWYAEHVGGDPDYSQLLVALAPTPAGRRDLLEEFFTFTDDEREAGKGVPTPAHHAIAELIAAGYIRVVVTTNFDRLLETALRQRNVEPSVIASAEAAKGATPLAHSGPVIVKLHGDYLSPDLRNTVEELSSYEPPLDTLLDRVFDEYGLLVAGWSGEWDNALRSAILRCSTHRYGCWWTHISPISPLVQDVVNLRQATDVTIKGADDFFPALLGKVLALEALTDRQPQSTAIAVAEAKRYLPEPRHRIRLHDLVMDEVGDIVSLPTIDTTPPPAPRPVLDAMRQIEGSAATMTAVLATVGFFANDPEQTRLLVNAVERLTLRRGRIDGTVTWVNLALYPALLAWYSAGIGSIAAGRIEHITALIDGRLVPHPNGAQQLTLVLDSSEVMDGAACALALGVEANNPQALFAVSDYLAAALREPLRFVLPGDTEYEAAFDDFEYLIGVVCLARGGRPRFGRCGRNHRATTERPFRTVVFDNAEALKAGRVFADGVVLTSAVGNFDVLLEHLP